MFENYEIKQESGLYHLEEYSKLKKFIITNHYSKSVARASYNFILRIDGKLRGVIQFGTPTGRNCSVYGKKVVELKRMVISRQCPKNTASWMIAKCIKDIRNNTKYTDIISYADQEFGHKGTVYKAANFQYLGTQKKAQAIIYNKKKWHIRICYQKKDGKFTKTAEMFRQLLKKKKAKFINLKPKHIYKYSLYNRNVL